MAHSYYPDHLWDNDQRVELKDNVLDVEYGKGTYSQDLIHSKALDYLDNLKEDEPFFMWYPTILPHAELIVPEDSIIKSSVVCIRKKLIKEQNRAIRDSVKGVTAHSFIRMLHSLR